MGRRNGGPNSYGGFRRGECFDWEPAATDHGDYHGDYGDYGDYEEYSIPTTGAPPPSSRTRRRERNDDRREEYYDQPQYTDRRGISRPMTDGSERRRGDENDTRYDVHVSVPGSRFEENRAAEARYDGKGRAYDKPGMRF